jgi:hypothetical protein
MKTKWLNPVALKISDGRLHLFVHLIQQICKIISMAATRAAPVDLSSGANHFQWARAIRANEAAHFSISIEHGSSAPFQWMGTI